MLRAIRKYNKWILVVGGTLLMITFLIGPIMQQLGGDPTKRVVARLDGRPILVRDEMRAAGEIYSLTQLTGGLVPTLLGIEERDPRHWILLKAEARDAGMIAEAEDGRAWFPELAEAMADQALNAQYAQLLGGRSWRMLMVQSPRLAEMLNLPSQHRELADLVLSTFDQRAERAAQDGRLTPQELDEALAAARGVFRLFDAYSRAARLSDRRAAARAKDILDGAYADVLAIPASRLIEEIPEPDAQAIQAQFERFKEVRPGEGDFGIGYTLPARVKLEWLTLDASAIEQALALDPVEVNKHYLQNRTKYPGEFTAERPNVEREMRSAQLTRIMQEAHRTIQAEVLRVTRRLESDGRYKALPPDWAENRPKLEAVAAAVVEQVRQATGVTIPLPSVTIRSGEWLTRDELAALPGIGFSEFRSGSLRIPFTQFVFSARELDADAARDFPVAVQAGIPLVESYLTDSAGARHYLTILDVRKESPPDSVEEIRERLVRDARTLQAYERLAARADELRGLAASGGLDAVRDLIFPPPAPPADPEATPPIDDRPAVARRVLVTRAGMQPPAGADIALADTERVREAIMTTAQGIDPFTPPEQIEPAPASLASPAPTSLALIVARVTALQPLTRERFRLVDAELVADARLAAQTAFSLAALLERHEYVSEEPERPQPTAEPAAAASSP